MLGNQVSLIMRTFTPIHLLTTLYHSLAYMELYIVLAQIFRRLVLELHSTDESDVELAHDFFLPSPKLDSKGVRVMVVGHSG